MVGPKVGQRAEHLSPPILRPILLSTGAGSQRSARDVSASRMDHDVGPGCETTLSQPLPCFGPRSVAQNQVSCARALWTCRRQRARKGRWTFIAETNVAVGKTFFGTPLEGA